MKIRLLAVGAALFALAFFAFQAWGGGTSTTIDAAEPESRAGDLEGRTVSVDAGEAAAAAALPNDAADAASGDPAVATGTETVAGGSDSGDAVGEERASLTRTVAQTDEGKTDDSGESEGDDTVTMTLLHNNDGESKLLPDPDGGFPGIARFAQAWVDLGRDTDADILLRVSAGDNFLASKEFSVSLARDGEPYYDSIALRGLYEVMALGNHDFDFGPDVTARFIEGFRLNSSSDPVMFVSSNIDVSAEPALQALVDEGRLAPSTVITDPTSGESVGVIGAITPRLANISSPGGVTVDSDVAAAVNAEVEALTEAGVDRIVLVSHLQGLGEDRELVPQLSGVDVVVAGGGDELLKNPGDTCLSDDEPAGDYPLLLSDADGLEVPVVTAPGGYRCIGRLDLTFDGAGRVVELDGTSIGVDVTGPGEEFAMTRVEEPLAEALADLDSTVIGSSEVTLDGRRTSVRTGPTNVGELLADALLATAQGEGAEVQVAVQNGGGIRNDAEIAAGEITEADTFDIAPFANFVVAGDVSREGLKDMLEAAVSGLPDAEGFYPQIAGMSVEVDVSQPARELDRDGDCSPVGDAGARIRSVTLDDGTEIVRDGAVVPGEAIGLATIDFLAAGGDCYPLGDFEFTPLGTSYQQALSRFIEQGLEGAISADDYPEGGANVVITGLDDPDTSDPDTSDPDSSDTDESATDDTDESATDDADDTATEDELPTTGLGSGIILVMALTVAAAGMLVFHEAQRAGWLSLANRLSATRAWIPNDNDAPND